MALDIGVVAELAVLERHPLADRSEPAELRIAKSRTRMDEGLAVIRGLSAGGYFEYHGEVFDLAPVKIAPVPSEPIPILIGGHGDAALRRAARVGDGWLHGGGGDDLPGLLARLGEFRRREGTPCGTTPRSERCSPPRRAWTSMFRRSRRTDSPGTSI